MTDITPNTTDSSNVTASNFDKNEWTCEVTLGPDYVSRSALKHLRRINAKRRGGKRRKRNAERRAKHDAAFFAQWKPHLEITEIK